MKVLRHCTFTFTDDSASNFYVSIRVSLNIYQKTVLFKFIISVSFIFIKVIVATLYMSVCLSST